MSQLVMDDSNVYMSTDGVAQYLCLVAFPSLGAFACMCHRSPKACGSIRHWCKDNPPISRAFICQATVELAVNIKRRNPLIGSATCVSVLARDMRRGVLAQPISDACFH